MILPIPEKCNRSNVEKHEPLEGDVGKLYTSNIMRHLQKTKIMPQLVSSQAHERSALQCVALPHLRHFETFLINKNYFISNVTIKKSYFYSILMYF